MNIGEYIRKEREAQGLSQSQLAERFGSTRHFVSLVENGKSNLTITNLEKFANALGMQLNPQLFVSK